MNDPETKAPPTRDWFATVLLCVVVAAIPTQYAYVKQQVNPDGGVTVIASIAVGDVMILLAFAAWAGRVLLKWRWKDLVWPCAPCVAIAAVGALSALHSELIAEQIDMVGSLLRAPLKSDMVKQSAAEWVQLVAYVIIGYALFTNLLKESRFLKGSLYVLFGVTTLAALIALKDYATVGEAQYVRGGLGEQACLFGSQNIYSGFMAMMLPLMLGFVLTTRNVAVKAWLLLVMVVGGITILGNGALAATLIVLPWCGFRHSRSTGWVTTAVTVGLLLVLCAAGTRTYHDNVRALLTIHDADGDVKKQYLEWQVGLDMLTDNFLFGVGTGLYQSNIGAFYGSLPNKRKMPWDSNNLYLVTGSTMGIAGLAALVYLFVHALRRANEVILRADESLRPLVVGMWGGVVAFAIVSVWNSLWARGTAPVLIYLISMIAVLSGSTGTLQEETDD